MIPLFRDVLLWIDVAVGHRFPNWLPMAIHSWWYDHVCMPSGLWECRD